MARARKIDYSQRAASLETKRGASLKDGKNRLRFLWARVDDGELLGSKRMVHFVRDMDEKGQPRTRAVVCPNSLVPDGIRVSHCPLCDAANKHRDKSDPLYEAFHGRNGVRANIKYAMNVIDRDTKEAIVVEVPFSVYKDILTLAKENYPEEDIFSPYASEGGSDIIINYDKKASPKDMYRVSLARERSNVTPDFDGVDPDSEKAEKLEAEIESKMTSLSTYTDPASVASKEELLGIVSMTEGSGGDYSDPPELGYRDEAKSESRPASNLDLRAYSEEFIADNADLIRTLETAAPSALIREFRNRNLGSTVGKSNDELIYAILDNEYDAYNSVPFDVNEPESEPAPASAAKGYNAVAERLNAGTNNRRRR